MGERYFRRLHKRAADKTNNLLGFGSWGQAMIRVILLVALVAGLAFWGSEDASRDEMVARITLAAVLVALYPLFYTWNIIRSALEIDADLSREVSGLRSKLDDANKPRPDFSQSSFDQIIIGNNTSFAPPGFVSIIANITLINTGNQPSAVRWWNVEIQNGQNVVPGRGSHIHEIIMTDDRLGENQVRLLGDRSIYNLSASPVPVGGMINGHFVGIFPPGAIPESQDDPSVLAGIVFRVRFGDVFGHEYTLERIMHGRGEEHLGYYPGMDVLPRDS